MRNIKLLSLLLLAVMGFSTAWANDIVLVGDASKQTTYRNRFMLSNKQAASETIYKAAHIGLESGTAFKRISYRGTYTGTETAVPMQVWIGNTTDDAPATSTSSNNTLVDISTLQGMIKIFDGEYTVSTVTAGEILSFDVPSSFRYEGNNLRVILIKPEDDTKKCNKDVYLYCGDTSFTDFKNTACQQGNANFSLVTSPFLWIETGVASDHNFAITSSTLPEKATINVAFQTSVTIKNNGIDEAANGYTVTYYVDDVAVQTADAPAVAKDGEQTYSFAHTFASVGRHTHYIEIAFPDGATVKTSKVSVLAEEADPRWSWDFEQNTWPGGAFYLNYSLDSYIHFSSNGYYITPKDQANSTLLFITPLLHAKAGEPFSFQAAKFEGFTATPEVKVMASKDRKEWTTVYTISESDFHGGKVGGSTSTLYAFEDFSFNFPLEEGDYYLAFQAGARLDNFYGFKLVDKDHDIMFMSEELPTSVTANNSAKASVTVMNLMDATETASAKYYINGREMGEAAQQSLTTRSEKTYAISFMAHEAGTFNSYIELTLADGTTVRSNEVEITVAEETPRGESTIGTYSSNYSSIPVQTASTGSYSDMIWPASLLQQYGIVEGTKIKGIVFKGYSSSNVTAPVQLWIANSTATTPVVGSTPADDIANTEGLTKVYDGNYTFEKGGSYGADNVIDIMTVNFEPFEYDGTNLRVHAQCVQSDTQSGVTFGNISNSGAAYKAKSQWSDNYYGNDNANLPLVSFLYDKEASHFTGVVTIKNADQTVSPIANAAITLTAEDGTAYIGQTDAEGHFDITVMQDTKTYAISVDYSEKNCLPMNLSVEFKGTSTEQDIQFVEGVDFYIERQDTPAKATTNNKYTATVTATNYNATTLPAGDYTATLYVDGKAVATAAEEVDVEAMAEQTFTFSYTPHETGSFAAYIELAGPNATVKTDVYEIVIGAESAGGETQVGEKSGQSNKTPFYWYDADTGLVMTDFAYTPTFLSHFGVVANSKINKITFKKSTNGSPKDISKVNLTVWIALEDASKAFVAGDVKTAEMRKFVIYDGVKANSGDDIVIDLSDAPIVYDGTSRIRVYVENNGNGTYAMTNYDYDNETEGFIKACYKKSSASSWNTDNGTPVAYFTLAAGSHYAGVAVDADNNVLEGAVVTLTNEEKDVVYTATSDADGKFDVLIVQNDLTYTVTAKKDNLTYEGTETVSFADGNIENLTLTLTPAMVAGDVNGDGVVDNADAVAIMRHLNDNTPATFIEANADVNGDGVVDNADAVTILRTLNE